MQPRGFLSALFDLSFSTMITAKIVQVLYVLALILSAITTLVVVAGAFEDSGGTGLVALVISPLIFLALAIVSRVYLEILIVIFKIADNTAVMAAHAAPVQPVSPTAELPAAE
jgi:hypothetical protein